MTTFRVWLRPLGGASKVRAEGLDNAHWLRQLLIDRGLTVTQPTPADIAGHYVFRVTHAAQTSHADLVRFLAGLAEVKLMVDPA